MPKFGLRIMEGYGATECAPVIAVNTPMHFQAGTVGRLLPGIEARLEPVPGITEGARLYVRGPNVMAGYLLASEACCNRRWKAGMIPAISWRWMMRVSSRSRAAPSALPRSAAKWSACLRWKAMPAMLARPCPCRRHPPRSQEGRGAGAVHQLPAADPRDLLQWGRGHGVTELMIPRDIRVLAELPVLGTGKLDYVTMGQMAQLPSAVSQEEDDEDALIQA
jgi:acyl-[acyl-carrier-protein]-phospholipid O-acyltransferase/long-chain-fatty-acid--[acyl-carrier-protein] ligase